MATDVGYQVEVARSGSWWAIRVPELPGLFSQARRLDKVEATAREAIAMMLEVPEPDVGALHVHVFPPEEVAELVAAANSASEEAATAAARAQELRLEAARRLRKSGLPMRDVGELIGLSHQRVSQLLARSSRRKVQSQRVPPRR